MPLQVVRALTPMPSLSQRGYPRLALRRWSPFLQAVTIVTVVTVDAGRGWRVGTNAADAYKPAKRSREARLTKWSPAQA